MIRSRLTSSAGVLFALLLVVTGCGGSSSDPPQATTTVQAAAPNLLSDGGFEETDLSAWMVESTDAAEIKLDMTEAVEGKQSLQIRATGSTKGKQTAFASQLLAELPERAKGTKYELTAKTMTAGLSRPLSFSVRLNYRDGSFEFFGGGPAGVTTGIPNGTDTNWSEVRAIAVARKPVETLTIFAFDVGANDLQGTAWIDDVRLTSSASGT